MRKLPRTPQSKVDWSEVGNRLIRDVPEWLQVTIAFAVVILGIIAALILLVLTIAAWQIMLPLWGLALLVVMAFIVRYLWRVATDSNGSDQ